jgi:orotate phosphoribosyltransferase
MKGVFLPYYGRKSPYIFRTPTPFTAGQLQAIGSNGAELVAERALTGRVHIIGIASRGIPLATAITIYLKAEHDREAVLSIVARDGSVDHLSIIQSSYTVLIDNALVSGRTMELALERVRSSGVNIDLMIYMFDREEVDNRGSESAARLSAEFDCEVISIFSLRDVIETVEDNIDRRTLKEYAQKFGTQSLRAYLVERSCE